MTGPKHILPSARLAEDIVDEREFMPLVLPSGVTINLSRHERLTSTHQSISREVMAVGIISADASKEMARFKYAVPAQEKTAQVRTIAIVVVIVAIAAFIAICMKPDASSAIATVAGIVVGVFGGIYTIEHLLRAKKTAD